MAKYTTELRTICENFAGYTERQDYNNIYNTIEQARPKLFNFPYTLFDENYKPILETKIIKHFYFREIGFETVAHFRFRLDETLNSILPYYNKLYESANLKFNPLYDTDLHKTSNTKGQMTEKGEQIDTTNKEQNTTTESVDDSNYSDNESNTGTIKNDTNKTIKDSETGKVKVVDTFNDNVKKSGTISEKTGSIQHKNSGADTKSYSGSQSESNDTWTTEHLTPQGSLTGLKSDNYLTSANHVEGTITRTPNNYKEVTDKGTTETETYNGLSDEQDITEKHTGDITHDTDETKTNDVTETDKNTETRDLHTTNEGTKHNTTNTTNNLTDSETKNQETTNNQNTTEEYLEHIYGKSSGVTYSKYIQEYRDILINIDMMILKDLEDLFMLIY